jgi:hypothetical protein
MIIEKELDIGVQHKRSKEKERRLTGAKLYEENITYEHQTK